MSRLTCQSLSLIIKECLCFGCCPQESEETLTRFGSITRSATSQQWVIQTLKKKKGKLSLTSRTWGQERKYRSHDICQSSEHQNGISQCALPVSGGAPKVEGTYLASTHLRLQLPYCKHNRVMLGVTMNELESVRSLNITQVQVNSLPGHSWSVVWFHTPGESGNEVTSICGPAIKQFITYHHFDSIKQLISNQLRDEGDMKLIYPNPLTIPW